MSTERVVVTRDCQHVNLSIPARIPYGCYARIMESGCASRCASHASGVPCVCREVRALSRAAVAIKLLRNTSNTSGICEFPHNLYQCPFDIVSQRERNFELFLAKANGGGSLGEGSKAEALAWVGAFGRQN
eukprot:6212034-Pleurochrysis_carterae.AAC.5